MSIYLGNELISPLIVKEPIIKLNAPILVKSVTNYILQNPTTNGSYPTAYKVFIDGQLYKTVYQSFTSGQTITIPFVDEMAQFVGTHTLSATLIAPNFVESDMSNEITFTIRTISQTLTNITSSNSSEYIYEGDSYTNTLTPATNYFLPSNITLTMSGQNIISTSYNDYTGLISITTVLGDIVIVADGETTNKLRTPWITLDDKTLFIRKVNNADKYYLYMDGTQVWEQELQVPNYTVEQVSDTASQQFVLNANDYYESQCQKVANGWSLCKIVFNGSGNCILHCISNGESSYDYGIIGNINQTLSSSNSDDGVTGTTKVKKNFKGESSTAVKDVVFDSINDGDFIMCKYRKDSSGDQGFDSLQFQVEVGV